MTQSDIKTKNKRILKLKNKKDTYIVITIGVVIILLGSVLLYSLVSIDDLEEKVEDLETTVTINQLITKTYAELEEEGLLEYIDIVDDRISPYTNQGVILEVLRIRHRGLLDKLMTPGFSWKIKPQFYFISEIDGMEYESHLVGQHRDYTEVLFNTWDSMFQENKIVRTAHQEQETSEVTLTIVERESIGLLGLRTRDIEKESFTVTYCYRTGRWTGDNYLGHPEGYGYYLGDTFEIWFNIYQTSPINDKIPYWTKVNILGLDPMVDYSDKDLDGDGIPVEWEWKWGYDPFTWDDHVNLDPDMDSLSNIQEYELEKYFADPFIENLYVEVNFLERTRKFLPDPPTVFYEETKQGLIERFAQHNIKAFFDDGWPNTPPNGGGQIAPYVETLSQDSGMILQYYNNYFPDERKGSFIFLLLGYRVGGGYQHPAVGNVYDTIYIWDIPFDVFAPLKHLRAWIAYGRSPTPRGVRIGQGGLLLHELGHFGGLVYDHFEGIDRVDYNFGGAAFDILQGKEFRETYGQYRSVMNYAYIGRVFDYSHGQNGPPYDFNDWANFHLGGWGGVSPVLEEAHYLTYDERFEENIKHVIEKDIDEIETLPITGYVYDQNLTEAFEKQVGEWSPNTRWNVEWAVHRLVEEEQYPHFRDIKVFVSPKDIASKYHHIWSLFMEGDFDSEGNIVFSHSIPFDTLTLN
jgi:hypothetical protein